MRSAVLKISQLFLAAALAACYLSALAVQYAHAEKTAEAATDVYVYIADSARVELIWQEGGGSLPPGADYRLAAGFSGCPEGATTYEWEVSLDGGATWAPVEGDASSYASTIGWPAGTDVKMKLTATNGAGQSASAIFDITVAAKAASATPAGVIAQMGDALGRSAALALAAACSSAFLAIAAYRRRRANERGHEND